MSGHYHPEVLSAAWSAQVRTFLMWQVRILLLQVSTFLRRQVGTFPYGRLQLPSRTQLLIYDPQWVRTRTECYRYVPVSTISPSLK